MQRVSEERSVQQDELRHEILELQRTLQNEQNLRNQAEAENLTDLEIEEAFCKEFDRQPQKEKRPRAAAERSQLYQRSEEA